MSAWQWISEVMVTNGQKDFFISIYTLWFCGISKFGFGIIMFVNSSTNKPLGSF